MEVVSLYKFIDSILGIIITVFTGYCLTFYYDCFMKKRIFLEDMVGIFL